MRSASGAGVNPTAVSPLRKRNVKCARHSKKSQKKCSIAHSLRGYRLSRGPRLSGSTTAVSGTQSFEGRVVIFPLLCCFRSLSSCGGEILRRMQDHAKLNARVSPPAPRHNVDVPHRLFFCCYGSYCFSAPFMNPVMLTKCQR